MLDKKLNININAFILGKQNVSQVNNIQNNSDNKFFSFYVLRSKVAA